MTDEYDLEPSRMPHVSKRITPVDKGDEPRFGSVAAGSYHFKMIELPKFSWEFSHTSAFDIRFQVSHAPSRFHRMMQRIVLGIHWRRVNDKALT